MFCWRVALSTYFNPRTPRGVRRGYGGFGGGNGVFQSTHPARGATPTGSVHMAICNISIHAPREGCDQSVHKTYITPTDFNPRTPRGVRPGSAPASAARWTFQSTHPARGATLQGHQRDPRDRISIHAPREGCDSLFPEKQPPAEYKFQSTHPARGATKCGHVFLLSLVYFNPRTPRGVRHPVPLCLHLHRLEFQSTHPARGATAGRPRSAARAAISIHAPREGCDAERDGGPHAAHEFQSTHPARGATRLLPRPGARQDYFNPRTPRGVRLLVAVVGPGRLNISIHAPREGCDTDFRAVRVQKFQFQSTHPARGATDSTIRYPGDSVNFNPRTPRGVRPGRRGATAPGPPDFNPRTPRGVRQQTLPKSREFAWLNLLICTRGRRLSIQKQTRLCSIKLSFMLFGCEPAGEGVSSWTSHATKSKVRLEGRSA